MGEQKRAARRPRMSERLAAAQAELLELRQRAVVLPQDVHRQLLDLVAEVGGDLTPEVALQAAVRELWERPGDVLARHWRRLPAIRPVLLSVKGA